MLSVELVVISCVSFLCIHGRVDVRTVVRSQNQITVAIGFVCLFVSFFFFFFLELIDRILKNVDSAAVMRHLLGENNKWQSVFVLKVNQ